MNRRSFIGVMAVMVVFPASAVACDDTHTALEMAARIIPVADRYHAFPAVLGDGLRNPERIKHRAVMTDMTDELIGFMLERFPPGAMVDEVHAIFRSPDDVDVSSLRPETVPVAIIHDLIARHGVELDIHRMKHWAAYVSRYKAVVVPSSV